jgi:glycosyltransferase involved in cell wall biosynthesis
MAYGRPVVATRVGGLVDLGAGATLVEPRELRATIETLLEDGELQRQRGSEAREHARVNFSRDVASAALIDIYQAAS